MDEQLQFTIQAYLDGSLKGQELDQFQIRLTSDEALAKEVALFQEMDDLLGESDVLDLENTIGKVFQAAHTEDLQAVVKETATVRQLKPKPKAFRRVLAIAAGIALIATVGSVLFLNNNESVSPESLYATSMEFPSELSGGSGLRSTDTTESIANETLQLKTAWATANKAYKIQQYETALTAINAIEQIDTNFDSEIKGNLLFKKGVVLLKLNRNKEAITFFEDVTDGDYILSAQWKRALALLLVDSNQAKIALEAIAKDSRHPESKNAATILEKL